MEILSYKTAIDLASNTIGTTWPLYSFVTSNPLSGYENMPFEKAVDKVSNLRNTTVYPESDVYQNAIAAGKIDVEILEGLLAKNNFKSSVEHYLNILQFEKRSDTYNSQKNLDQIVTKWLMVFMDEGLAEWNMPNREKGFYTAWRQLARYDKQINSDLTESIPETAGLALQMVLAKYATAEVQEILEYHLAALPGWVGYIKKRQENKTQWQEEFQITIEDYLAVRLWIAYANNEVIIPDLKKSADATANLKLQHLFLQAWEKTWQRNLVKNLEKSKINLLKEESDAFYDAQFVFCIDTRSELIRRHVEAAGNYETFGYAGFFGIAMDYKSPNNDIVRKSCPPIVTSAYKVTEEPNSNQSTAFSKYQKKVETKQFSTYFLRRMKNMLPSAFGYVEGSGLIYGASLLSRTLFPAANYNPDKNNKTAYENSCTPEINYHLDSSETLDISLAEKVGIVKGAFESMGWNSFAPLVMFVGHGSHTANNAFGSSLDCGACAASPGRHNARMLAKLANLKEVRSELQLKYNIKIPNETFFMGAEHNTTTDEIVVFANEIPSGLQPQLATLQANLKKIQKNASSERLNSKNSIQTAYKKATNWSETRPEWGLAKNAGFIIGPRTLTKNLHMDGNCFMNSYNWKLDQDGANLQGIMQGPMVVTQWINNHYYFSTVDNENFGSGSKITHNITGNFGVVQGNGGDLKMGLPLQSVKETDSKNYHDPLRISVVIQAPKIWVEKILSENENLKALLDHRWIYLIVTDPTADDTFYRYEENMEWSAINQEEAVFEQMSK